MTKLTPFSVTFVLVFLKVKLFFEVLSLFSWWFKSGVIVLGKYCCGPDKASGC